MTYQEMHKAIMCGLDVFWKDSIVVHEQDYCFTFPYSPFAIKDKNGSLQYIVQWHGDDVNFVVKEQQ